MHPDLLRALAKARHGDLLTPRQNPGTQSPTRCPSTAVRSFPSTAWLTFHLGRLTTHW